MLFESHKAEACEWLSGTEFLFLLHLERWRSYAVTRETWVRKARTVQRGTSVHSWQWKVTPLGLHFDPESWRITWRRICPRGTNWQYIDTKMTDGRPFGKRVGSVCFVTRTAVSFTRSVQGCPMIMIVKITLLVVAGAGGALRHKGIPPALVCGSLGSVSPSPVSGEAGHPASSVDQQEDRGLFQHPPEHRWQTWAALVSHWHSSWLADCGFHTQAHTEGLSPSGFWTLSIHSGPQTLVSFSCCWHLDLQPLRFAASCSSSWKTSATHAETMVASPARELTVVRAFPHEKVGNSVYQECHLGHSD